MRFLFTCGGTAGHINPALGVAGKLRELMPDAEILFVGAKGNMETELVPREGYDIATITITNLRRSFKPKMIVHNLKTVKNVFSATAEAKRIIRDFRPDVAVGTGGYVCYPVLAAAAKLGVPTLVHESNAVPGLTTKMLAGKVDKILVGFEESRGNYAQKEKVEVTGTPVRCEFTDMTKAEAKAELGLPAEKPLVVSVWGSLGADHMNRVMAELICAMEPGEFSLIHATGKRGYSSFAQRLKSAGADGKAGVDVREYIYNMPLVMEAADLVMCRAGASTLSELAVLGKPAILVPSPNVTNNHQEKNARVMESAGAARVLLEGEFSAESILSDIRTLLKDGVTLEAMGKNMLTQGNSKATDEIAAIVLELTQRNSGKK
ncbi:MAG: undecaprenyldiphospho-muramoylpentapeptide beta-N-acetylglucosaminyltransferase [Candidatus Heteroscillospira sp.]|jgi:UDP-N-acetylglucosamine--N-acetylmuramyl-(pentapeptide) pyrophosphoryl-undecaprenol N-acetylglucosamine transferase